MASILDAVLLPAEYFNRLAVSKKTYAFCFAVVGLFRVAPALLLDNGQRLFFGRTLWIALPNAAIALLYTFAAGALDCFLFCRPLADFLSYLAGKMGGRRDGTLCLKTMKIYAIATLLVQSLCLLATRALLGAGAGAGAAYAICVVLFHAWLFAIVGRGLGCILRFKGKHRFYVVPATLAWGAMWSLIASALVSRFLPSFFF